MHVVAHYGRVYVVEGGARFLIVATREGYVPYHNLQLFVIDINLSIAGAGKTILAYVPSSFFERWP